MDQIVVYLLIYFILFGAVGMLIGQRKGRTLAGLIWSMVLGPIGWLLILLGPTVGGPKRVDCPHCGGVLPASQVKCNHCGNAVRWIKGKAFKPSRAAP